MELVSSFALLKQEIEMASSLDISSPVDLGKVQNKMGQPQEAVRSFRKALELDPSLHNVHYQLATICPTLGRPDAAKEELEKFEAARKEELKMFEERQKQTRR
jgi:tetratricopeptide (TPR) repeat protein